ncbi:ABC transporter substrate-binding protein [Rhizobium rhizogenes]|uniref:ABC transporter substrate-binding protein n=1 Tax=Rhizobium rhizogenes TaxID=359 RepID=UPI001571B4A2|nr:ABC transporter substrate-binding protein [Rhizobium rhizogenes]NTF44275.1 ABC transporter substrate-binding protein [Rhizobium rhizogenes]
MTISKAFAFGIAALGFTAAYPALSQAATINIFCSSSGIELQLCKEGTEAWAKESGNEVKITTMPANWDDVLSLYQQLLSAQSTDVDVMILDGVWVGPLKSHLLDLKDALPAGSVDKYFPSAVAAGTVNGKFIAMPWYMDTGLLFYRKDLLDKYGAKVPETWADLTTTAQLVQDGERKAGNEKMWGYVWQGRAYEGLVCNATEWFASSGAGTFIDADGKITIGSPAAKEILKTAAGWAGTISPQGVLNYDEEGSRGVFQNGDAVFMRNWAYAWSLANGTDSAIKDKVGVAPLPKGANGQHVGIDGAAYLGVSKYSTHPKEAAALIAYLAGEKEEKRRALAGSYIPSISSLFSDADVLKAIPFLTTAKAAFENVVTRPTSVTGSDYPRVSTEISNSLHTALADPSASDAAIDDLASKLDALKSRGGW